MQFIIHHIYDEDGGFGDAVQIDEVIGVLECTPSQLKEYLDRYNKKTAYCQPYATLYCGELKAEAVDDIKLLFLNEDPIPEVRNWPERYGYTGE